VASSRLNYPPDAVEAAKAVLVEVVHILGEYRDEMTLVGGWVPALLLPDGDSHVGSTDVDIAFDHKAVSDDVYARIGDTLRQNGYEQDKRQPFIWYREVDLGQGPLTVELDFLAGEYEGQGSSHRTQRVQDVHMRKARGADLLGDLSVERQIEARLPSGAIDRVSIRVAGIVPFIVMKASALEGRIKSKDAYDIHYCLRNYPGGVTAVAEEFSPHAEHGLVQEAAHALGNKFASPEHVGPRLVVEFEEATGEEAELLARDAYERVQVLLEALRVVE